MKSVFLFFLTLITVSARARELQDMQYTVLWGVVNSKGDTSYLFGVLHDLGDSYFNKYPAIKRELRNAQAIVLESKYAPKTGKVEKTDYSGWYNSMSKQDFDLINDYFKKSAKKISKHARLSLRAFRRRNYSPMDVYGIFLHTEVYVNCGIHLEKKEQPLEEYLTDWCRYHNDQRHQIPIIGLETSSDVKSNVFGIEDKNILDSMKTAILHPETQDVGCSFIDTYRNMTGFNYDFKKASETVDTTNAYLLNKRNDHWMPEIIKAIQDKRTFIAVGMLHLAYRDGLINQLMAAGYTVFPIAMKQP